MLQLDERGASDSLRSVNIRNRACINRHDFWSYSKAFTLELKHEVLLN